MCDCEHKCGINGPFCIIFPLRPLLKLGCLICKAQNKAAALQVVSEAAGVHVTSVSELHRLGPQQALRALLALRLTA